MTAILVCVRSRSSGWTEYVEVVLSWSVEKEEERSVIIGIL